MKKLFLIFLNVIIFVLMFNFVLASSADNFNSSNYWDKWQGYMGINNGYNTNELGVGGIGEVGYLDLGLVLSGNYIHNNLIYISGGLNYYPVDDLVMGGSYSYYPSDNEARNCDYAEGYESYNGHIGYDFGLVETDIQYKKDTDGDWYVGNIEYNINDNWDAYGEYQYNESLQDKVSVGLKYTWDSTYRKR